MENHLEPAQENHPFLAKWLTSVGGTVGGIVAYMAISGIFDYIADTTNSFSMLAFVYLFWVVLLGVYAYYAFAIYPSLFTRSPKVDLSPTAISFINGLVGGIIFGCLWNTCLTKGKIGISHYIAGVCCTLGSLMYVANLYILFTW